MYQVKINGLRYDLPESTEELTLGQFLDLRQIKDNSTIRQLSILLSADEGIIADLPNKKSIELEVRNTIALAQVVNKDIERLFTTDEKLIVPKELTLLGKTIAIPGDIDKQPFWASRVVKQIIVDQVKKTGTGEKFDPTDCTDQIIAHYLYVPYTEMKYNEIRAEEFRQIIRELPLKTSIQLGNFFFLKSKSLYLTKFDCWITSLIIWSKKRAYRRSRSLEV